MAPAEHLEWFQDNIDWFLALPVAALSTPVPACPGWDVERVVTHLSYGLGVGYPHALRAVPTTDDAVVFLDLELPTELPTGSAALADFDLRMNSCSATFRDIDPQAPCYTYAGPGVAAFWFRRAAIETTLHRFDVAEALNVHEPLRFERAIDGLEEAVTFALPLAATWTASSPSAAVVVRPNGDSPSFQLGDGPVAAEISGDGETVFAALWGRSTDRVEIAGDEAVAHQWLSLVERAFAGR